MSKLHDLIDKRQFTTSILVAFVLLLLTSLGAWLLKLEFLKTLYILDKIYIFVFVFVITWLFLIHKKAKEILSKPIERIVEDKIASKGIIKALDECNEDIRKIRQSLSQIYDKAKMYEDIQPDEDIEFLLSTVGASYRDPIAKDTLFDKFRSRYKDLAINDVTLLFNRKINFAETRNLLDPVEIDGKTCYKVKNYGYEFMRILEIKRKSEETKK